MDDLEWPQITFQSEIDDVKLKFDLKFDFELIEENFCNMQNWISL